MPEAAHGPMNTPYYKVIACEIALREICQVAARSPSLLDLEFVTQGLHDTPATGGVEIQRRIDAVPEGRFDAILVGYGLCGNLVRGLRARHTPLVLPRAHDCITFLLGSRDRYQHRLEANPGTYYYSSGWLECARRRGLKGASEGSGFLPTRADGQGDREALLAKWTEKYGEDEARYLLETMEDWSRHYSHGALIDFDFTRPLALDVQVKSICAARGWRFEAVPGDLGLLQRWVGGEWSDQEFLVVRPGEEITPAYDGSIVATQPATTAPG